MREYWKMFEILFFLFICLILPRPTYMSPDNLALLASTLKTMQRAACDDEIVSLACPKGTLISIQVAQYGKAAPEGYSCTVKDLNPRALEVEVVGEEQCLWPNAMQYSLLQTVVEACQKKPQCKFSTKSKSGSVDPCPLSRKFVEVAYKCRPNEFRSRTGCENDIIKLSCSPHSRIAILDAQYGQSVNRCSQTMGVAEETCTASLVAEKVMQICHGKRRCQIVANHNNTFGTLCKPVSTNYLKIIYACVPLGVLTEKYETAAEKDEITAIHSESERNNNLFDDNDNADDEWVDLNPAPPFSNPALVSSNHDVDYEQHQIVDMTKHGRGREYSERNIPDTPNSTPNLIIYISVCVVVIIFAVIIIIGVRCFIMKRTKRNSKTGDMFTTEAPNIFGDGLSDIDNDVDVSHISGTFYDPGHPDIILYKDLPGTSTLRAMRPLSTVYPTAGSSMYGNVDFVPPQSRDATTSIFSNDKRIDCDVIVSPKSLRGYSNSQFFYG